MVGMALQQPEHSRLAVWTDHTWDAGDGLPADICGGRYLRMASDGLTYTVDREDRVPGLLLDGLVVVERSDEQMVIDAAEDAASENVYLHHVSVDEAGRIDGLWNVATQQWESWSVQPTYPAITLMPITEHLSREL